MENDGAISKRSIKILLVGDVSVSRERGVL